MALGVESVNLGEMPMPYYLKEEPYPMTIFAATILWRNLWTFLLSTSYEEFAKTPFFILLRAEIEVYSKIVIFSLSQTANKLTLTARAASNLHGDTERASDSIWLSPHFRNHLRFPIDVIEKKLTHPVKIFNPKFIAK